MFLPVLLCRAMDNDTWWLLALGKSITTEGIPTIEPLTMHEGLSFVPQQWLSALTFSSVYNALGSIGIAALCCVLFGVIIWLLYKLCLMHSGPARAAIVTGLSGALLVFLSITARPQIFSYIVVLSELILLEKYARTGKWQYLIAIPLLSVFEINAHASMWPLMIVFMIPYMVEWACKKITAKTGKEEKIDKLGIEQRQFKGLPLFLCAIATLGGGLVNPYGFRSMTYLFRSYGVESINNAVTEMQAPSWATGKVVFIVLLATVIFLCLKKKKTNTASLCLFAGTFVLAITAIKGFAYFLFAAAPLVAASLPVYQPKQSTPSLSPKQKRVLGCILLSVVALMSVFTLQPIETDAFGMKGAVAYMNTNFVVNEDDRIYAGYNTGGYLEFCGYKPYLDARAEVFLKANNGKADILDESFRVETNPLLVKDFLDKYDFRFVFAETNKSISYYLSNTDEEVHGYTLATTTASGNNKLQLWVKSDEKSSK